MNPLLNPQITGNVGLYYCCYRLSQLGWNAMPTARNARGVDILVYSQDSSRFAGIQVKSLSKRSPVPLGKSLDRLMGTYWVIINQLATGTPSAFILLPSEVEGLAHRGMKEDRVSFWLQPKDYEQDRFREAWDRIGHGGPLKSAIAVPEPEPPSSQHPTARTRRSNEIPPCPMRRNTPILHRSGGAVVVL
jgi:hypothetical protein